MVNFTNVARMLLSHVPHEYLEGVDEVILTNLSALSRERRRERTTSGTRVDQTCGLYYPSAKGRAARIEILVDATLRRLPLLLWRFSFLRSFAFSEVLYHEIGHHISFLRRDSRVDRENSAEIHAAKLFTLFFRKKYWYLRPFISPLHWICKDSTKQSPV